MEFAFILPVLVVMTLGLLEISILLFDMHKASESTRRAARELVITPAISDFSVVPVTCPGGAGCNATVIATVVSHLQALIPGIDQSNLQVSYNDSGLPVNAAAGFVMIPMVTVRLTGVQHNFPILGNLVPGIPSSITLPDFKTSQIASAQAL